MSPTFKSSCSCRSPRRTRRRSPRQSRSTPERSEPMASSVFLHIGLPKTATTYLQTILWGSWQALADQGVLMPGEARHDHLWASRIVREDPQFRSASEHRRSAWQRILDDIV